MISSNLYKYQNRDFKVKVTVGTHYKTMLSLYTGKMIISELGNWLNNWLIVLDLSVYPVIRCVHVKANSPGTELARIAELINLCCVYINHIGKTGQPDPKSTLHGWPLCCHISAASSLYTSPYTWFVLCLQFKKLLLS